MDFEERMKKDLTQRRKDAEEEKKRGKREKKEKIRIPLPLCDSASLREALPLELSKLDKVVEKPIRDMNTPERWGTFFQYLRDKKKRGIINEIIASEEGIAMASEVLMTISRDEVERARLRSEEKYELDTQSKLTYAKREGERKGRLEGEQEIINLLKSGKSPEEIIRGYGSQDGN
jgi:hypothetical protein